MPHKKDHPFKNKHMSVTQRVVFSLITFTFKVVGFVSPVLAGRLALKLFMTPTRFRTPRKEKVLRESADLKFVTVHNRKISVRSWGDEGSPSVLISHGWGGRCTQLHAFIEPLVEAGYRVVGFDVPGHGDSEGKLTNMMDVAYTISEIEKQEDAPFEAIIGHSFGSGTTLLAIDKYGVVAQKVVLISCFSNVKWVTSLFGELFDLKESTLIAMRDIGRQRFKDTYGISWTWEDVSPEHTVHSFKGDLFLIHDEDDHEVPTSEAEALRNAAPQALTMTTSGYGHRKILMNKEVVQATVDFIQGDGTKHV